MVEGGALSFTNVNLVERCSAFESTDEEEPRRIVNDGAGWLLVVVLVVALLVVLLVVLLVLLLVLVGLVVRVVMLGILGLRLVAAAVVVVSTREKVTCQSF